MKKRIWGILLAVVMAAGLLALTASAAPQDEYELTAPGLVGTFNEWGVTADTMMTQTQTAPGIWEATMEGCSGSFEFKVRNGGNWTPSLGGTFSELGTPFDLVTSGGNIVVTLTETTNLRFTLDLTNYNSTDGTGAKLTVADANGRSTTTIAFAGSYAPGREYNGEALSNPAAADMLISGADYDDAVFTWYEDSVSEENKLSTPPVNAGTYYLVASIPETAQASGSTATSGAIVITPKAWNHQNNPIIWPTGFSTTYEPDQTLADLDLTQANQAHPELGTFQWSDPTETPVVEDEYYQLTFIPTVLTLRNYSGLNQYGVSRDVDVTVAKADSAVTAVPEAVSDLICTGEAQNLVTAGAAVGGQLQYSLGGVTYSADIPKGTDADTYTVYYKVVGDANHNDTVPASVSVTIAAPAPIPPVITTAALPGGTVGAAYSQPLAATGDAPFVWSVTGGSLPAGLSLTDGAICGTPTAGGTFTFTVQAANGGGNDTRELSIVISEPYYEPTYKVTVDNAIENGTVKSNRTYVTYGSTVTLTVTPDAGYELDTLTVTDSLGKTIAVTDKGNGKYTFQMPWRKVTVEASFRAVHVCPSVEYTDVDQSLWYHEGIDYVLDKGLVDGVTDTAFDPDGIATRALLVTAIWRSEGSPVVDYLMTYSDVEQTNDHADAIRWATSVGVVEGFPDGSFRPDEAITREQMAVIFYRYERYKGEGFDGDWEYELTYADADQVGDWAYEAVCWNTLNGVVQGDGTNYDPKGTATRAHVSQLLMNYLER